MSLLSSTSKMRRSLRLGATGRGCGGLGFRLGSLARLTGRSDGRQFQPESRAVPAPGARRREPAAERLGKRPADRQPQPEPSGSASKVVLALLERVEHPRQDLGINADAGVFKLDREPSQVGLAGLFGGAGRVDRADRQPAAGRCELGGVANQVPHDLHDPRRGRPSHGGAGP